METDRILLVPCSPELAGRAADYYSRNREFFRPFDTVKDDDFFTEEHQRALLMRDAEDALQGRSARFFIVRPGEPERVIGIAGLNNIIQKSFLSAFLGYKLDRELLNNGYMTEAVGLLVDYAFNTLGLHRIEANVMPRNKASLRVLEKNGFENEGLAKRYININGVWEDHIHMVKLNGNIE